MLQKALSLVLVTFRNGVMPLLHIKISRLVCDLASCRANQKNGGAVQDCSNEAELLSGASARASYLLCFGFVQGTYHVDLCSAMRLGRQHSASTDTVVIMEQSRRIVLA